MWENQVSRVGVEGLSPNFSENLAEGYLKSHGVLQARILERVAISFSSGPRFVRTLHYDLSWMALHSMARNFTELLMQALLPQQGCVPVDDFELWCWRRPLRVPWTARRSNQSIQFSSVAQSYLTICDPMDCSTPGFPVLHHLLEFAQIHVH